jgi:hypothetical protein
MTEAFPRSAAQADAAASRTEHHESEPPRFRVCAYPAAGRFLAAALAVVSGASMPLILAAVLLASDPPITPPVLVRVFTLLALVPAFGAWLVRRAFDAEIEVEPERLVVWRRGLRVEVPGKAIAGVKPWIVPLPGVGFALRLRSGRRFAYGLCGDDAGRLLRALSEQAAVEAATVAARHPIIVYADARRSAVRRRWYHWTVKFPLFALLPAAVLFNAHQHIAFGGTFGQYYLEGLGPYLTTFAVYWLTVVIYLILYAAVWRGAAEAIAFVVAFFGPARAARRAVEIACRALYYGGVPLLLALRFSG